MSSLQHRFKVKRSTTTSIALATEKIATAKGSNCYVNPGLRDVAKSFDKVWREWLKYKIKNLRLNSLLQKAVCDYISDIYILRNMNGRSMN